MSEEQAEPFVLPVYSRRWGRHDNYSIRLTPTGWHIKHISIDGDCDPTGRPILHENLEQDSIAHPPTLDLKMRSLWQRASGGNMSREEIQAGLNAIGAIIEESERGRRRR